MSIGSSEEAVIALSAISPVKFGREGGSMARVIEALDDFGQPNRPIFGPREIEDEKWGGLAVPIGEMALRVEPAGWDILHRWVVRPSVFWVGTQDELREEVLPQVCIRYVDLKEISPQEWGRRAREVWKKFSEK